MTATDIRRQVTDRIVDALRAGTPPWRRPWRPDRTNTGVAANALSGHTYRGVNALLLSVSGYECRWWATFAQVQALGGRVRKGERSTRIVFYRRVERAVGATAAGDEVIDTFPLLRTYSVFNVEQTDGLGQLLPRACETPRAFTTFTPAEAVLAASGADIRYGGGKAEYDPDRDSIRLPEREAFAAPHEFYATAFHELAHWTGHASRLDRLTRNARFGSTAYAREELVAEMGGCFLAAELGVPHGDDLTNHAAYLASWLRVLGADPTAIFTAAAQASAAAGYLFSHAPQPHGPAAVADGIAA